MTTQSPHLYERQPRSAAAPRADRGPGKASTAQTRVPWWAVALPVVAFAVLLALLSGGTADASTAASHGDLFGRLGAVFSALVHHLI
ncbi:hypothetical protein [Streptomyces sp. NBC_00448]|uniref:hypothetical protein n=1 Tax=Streptomyces sp. NBC_00448 TaxID=2903652 RepID=UPI002E21626F